MPLRRIQDQDVNSSCSIGEELKLDIQLEKLGKFAETFPLNCPKTEILKARAYKYLIDHPDGIDVQDATGTNIRIDSRGPEVLRILPHRYPFLMVDRIVDMVGESKCTGMKNVTINEPYFPGHFPGHPIMPGVLQLEAMAQVSSVLMLRKPENAGKIGYFMSANEVKFRKPVVPGDTLFIEAEILKVKRSIGVARARCVVNHETVSEGELMFSLLER